MIYGDIEYVLENNFNILTLFAETSQQGCNWQWNYYKQTPKYEIFIQMRLIALLAKNLIIRI